jgi:NTP pyrophosphatase (non-canonical NTP hydrolase)
MVHKGPLSSGGSRTAARTFNKLMYTQPIIEVGDKVIYAGVKYEVAEVRPRPGGLMIGIYDKPPGNHVDFLNPDNVELVEKCGRNPVKGLPSTTLDPFHAEKFVDYFRLLQTAVHKVNVGNGWWASEDADFLQALAASINPLTGEPAIANRLSDISSKIREHNDGELIALMHSELSEALEGHRHGNPPSDHIPEFSALEEEMADVIIRIMDYSEKRKLNVAVAIIAKLAFNAGRGSKHGGKAC